MSVNWFFLAALNHELACSHTKLSKHLTRPRMKDRKRETPRHIHANEKIVLRDEVRLY